MQSNTTYAQKLRALLSPTEQSVFALLNTPQKIQTFLDTIPINFELKGETIYSPRMLLQERKAHCIEGALFAATSLAYHGARPLLLDFQTTPEDQDHVIAVFKENNLWGAISKTNHASLRWRDPVYKTIRELAMSYFHEYILPDGRKTLRAYSRPFDLRRYAPEQWVTTTKKLEWLAEDLDDSLHFPTASARALRSCGRASKMERAQLSRPEWKIKR